MSDRALLVTHLTSALANTSFAVSNQLPFNSAGTPVYERNFRTLYVSDTESETIPLFLTLDLNDILITQFTLTVIFAADAKTRNSDTDTVLNTLRAAGSIFQATTESTVNISQSITDDYQITTAEITFRRL